MNIEQIFADAKVEELLINGPGVAWIYRGRDRVRIDQPFTDVAQATQWIQDLAWRHGVRLDPQFPANGGMFAEQNLRWHCVLPPVAESGPLIAVRRHNFAALRLGDFAITAEQLRCFDDIFAKRRPLLICGATGSGKTSLLAALLRHYLLQQRILIIEHLPELPRASEQWLRLIERAPDVDGEGAVSIDQLFEEALRLRPDRFVVGEIRGREAPVFVRSLHAGHGGSFATMHAGDAYSCRRRLEELCSIYGAEAGVINVAEILHSQQCHIAVLERNLACIRVRELAML